MSTTSTISPLRATLLTAIQVFEIALLGVVGIPALLAERMEPGLLIIGLSMLVLPSALRLLVSGRLAAPTLAIWPLIMLLLLSALTVRITPSWQHTWPELVRLLWGIALCLAVINWANPLHQATPFAQRAQRHLSPRLIWATVAFFGLGVAQTAGGLLVMGPTHKIARFDAWLALLPDLPLATGLGFNPNRVAGVAVLLAPLALALTLGPLRPHHGSSMRWVGWLLTKMAAVLLALFFCGALVLTQSRGAWLAAGSALLVILSLLGRRGWIMLAILALLGGSTLAAIGPERILSRLTVFDSRKIDPSALIQDRNLAGRLILWQRAIHGIADAPLTGMGLAAFEAVSQQPYPQVAGYAPDPDMSHVHNILLQVGLDFGTPGLLTFLGLLAMIAWLLWSLVRCAQTASPLHTWSLGLLGSFVAYLVYNQFDAITLGARPAVAVWFLFGIWIGAGEWAQTMALQPHRVRRRSRTSPMTISPPTDRLFNDRPDPWPTQPTSQPTGALVNQLPIEPTNQDAWEARAWVVTAGGHEQ